MFLHILQYLGSTPIMLTGNASAKTARMQQAQQVVKLFKVHVHTRTTYAIHVLCTCMTESCVVNLGHPWEGVVTLFSAH